MRAFILVAAAGLAAAACTSRRTVGQPSLSVVDQTLTFAPHDKVDILFMIDDSNSMAPKQARLQASFPTLVQRIQQLASSGAPASFHIGVVDSDLGAADDVQACAKAGGDGGKLRTAASSQSANAPADCAGFQLPDDTPYIDYDSAKGTSNTGTLAVADAFSCLASVGDNGCGFEAQLESVYQALVPGVNPGFLRDDALLVVAWLTDEDDCSAPPDTTLFDNTPEAMAKWGVLQSFRCTQFGITCDGAPLDGSPLMAQSCAPSVGGPLFDVSRYTGLFGVGGVKADPADVLLVSIAAPPTPFTVDVTSPCSGQATVASCPVLEHSCVSADDPQIFGDPAVRLSAVMSSTVNSVSASICDDDDALLGSVADAMEARMRAGCLPGAVVDLTDTGCTVSVGGVDTARCDGSERLPCWDLVQDAGCPARMTPGGAQQTLRFTVDGASLAAVNAVCPLYEPAT
ncbi:MAG TPA: hypothetical protein VGL86_18860 [Polyangia bacterium]